jgi:hypothetical protein
MNYVRSTIDVISPLPPSPVLAAVRVPVLTSTSAAPRVGALSALTWGMDDLGDLLISMNRGSGDVVLIIAGNLGL